MMRDDLLPDSLEDDESEDASPPAPGRTRPFADREVPLGPSPMTIADAVHAWLDGEGSEDSARRFGRAEDVEFWKRLEGAVRAGRRATAPTGLQARVLDAIRELED